MTRKKLIAANWKMYRTPEQTTTFFAEFLPMVAGHTRDEIVVCPLRQQITQFAHVLQTGLFPVLNEELGELTEPAKRLVATLEMIPLARFVPSSRGWVGRPSKDRLAIASAFVAKAVYGFGT